MERLYKWKFKDRNDSMKSIQEKFKVQVDKLKELEIKILRALFKEGEAHLKYYFTTMSCFKYPERRVKCYDTVYYEEVLPEIARILKEHENLKIAKI